MANKIYTSSLLATLMVSGLAVTQADAFGLRGGFRGFGHRSTAPRTPMARPSAAPNPAGPGIGTTIAGTAAGVVAGNAISGAMSGSSNEGKGSANPQQANPGQPAAPQSSEPATVPMISSEAGQEVDNAAMQQEMSNPCTQSLEQRNPKIEELCGQLHQEIRQMHQKKAEQAPARQD